MEQDIKVMHKGLCILAYSLELGKFSFSFALVSVYELIL